jgi:hypothetical protein
MMRSADEELELDLSKAKGMPLMFFSVTEDRELIPPF